MTQPVKIEFDTTGLDWVEKTLLSIEPAVVNASVEQLEIAVKQIIELIRSHIPSGMKELRDSILGKIVVYEGGQKIFVTVGIGGENWKDIEGLDINEPLRFGRWHERGWNPKWMTKQLPSTSNAVERGNRRFRKMQKTVYRVRTCDHIKQRVSLDMFRELHLPSRRQTVQSLHDARAG